MMLCNSVRDLKELDLSNYLIETKFDGTRIFYFTKSNKFINRSGVDSRYKYPEIESHACWKKQTKL